jgi:aerobic carbon-monoxide dehydrogenase large subunit
LGELGTIGATPAVANAVLDALIRAGRADAVLKLQMPLTTDKIWAALMSSPSPPFRAERDLG